MQQESSKYCTFWAIEKQERPPLTLAVPCSCSITLKTFPYAKFTILEFSLQFFAFATVFIFRWLLGIPGLLQWTILSRCLELAARAPTYAIGQRSLFFFVLGRAGPGSRFYIYSVNWALPLQASRWICKVKPPLYDTTGILESWEEICIFSCNQLKSNLLDLELRM